MHLRSIAVISAFTLAPLFAEADETSQKSRDQMTIHQQEIRDGMNEVNQNRRRLIEQNLQLAPAEANAFWDIYGEYRTESDKLDETAIGLSLDFEESFAKGTVSEEQALKLQKRMIDLEDKRQALKETYVKRLSKDVSPIRALRFLQIETLLDGMATVESIRAVPLAQ